MRHFLLALATISLVSASKSPKKGIIIPSWPRHFCFDFDAFDTVRYVQGTSHVEGYSNFMSIKSPAVVWSWWYNYYTYEDVGDVSPWWCTYSNGTRPKGQSTRFNISGIWFWWWVQEKIGKIAFPLTLKSLLFQWSLASLVMVYMATTLSPILIRNTRLAWFLFFAQTMSQFSGDPGLQWARPGGAPVGHSSWRGCPCLDSTAGKISWPSEMGGVLNVSFQPGPCSSWSKQHDQRLVWRVHGSLRCSWMQVCNQLLLPLWPFWPIYLPLLSLRLFYLSYISYLSASSNHRIDYLACHSYVLAPKAQIKKLQEFSERWYESNIDEDSTELFRYKYTKIQRSSRQLTKGNIVDDSTTSTQHFRFGGRKIWYTEFAMAREHDEVKSCLLGKCKCSKALDQMTRLECIR